ncbi:MAG: 3-terminal phosphate cyclase [Myxococcales bacterium]|nr:3-terminal phosphate cyclase [Myxococcales bacterium]
MAEDVEIDGSRGEGGGQILRTSLALSIITQRPLRMTRIRAGRARPGLQRQHLACVEAAARLCSAQTHGAELGSQTLEFVPSIGYADHVTIDIGSAGSTTLVVQTILVPAIAASVPLRATIIGGTHNPLAPPFEFLERVFVPQLRAMGADVTLTLVKHGVMPKGGGEVQLETAGKTQLRRLELTKAGEIGSRRATVILARIPTHVADRELAVVRERLGKVESEIRDLRGGPANVLMVEIDRGTARELVTEHGEKGTRAELVATRACDDIERYLASGAPVGEHLADQLLLPMAVAGAGRFRTLAPLSLHATTNIATIGAFLDVPIRVEPAATTVDVIVGQG